MSIFSLFERIAQHSNLMDAMMDKLGVRDQLAQRPHGGAVLRRAADRCLSCDHAEACEGWLSKAQSVEEAPDYCRNHDLFQRLKAEVPAQ